MNWIIPWDDLETSEKRRRKFSDGGNYQPYAKKRMSNNVNNNDLETVSLTNNDESKHETVRHFLLFIN